MSLCPVRQFPPSPTTSPPLSPSLLWTALSTQQQKQLLLALSQLLARRLTVPIAVEVDRELA